MRIFTRAIQGEGGTNSYIITSQLHSQCIQTRTELTSGEKYKYTNVRETCGLDVHRDMCEYKSKSSVHIRIIIALLQGIRGHDKSIAMNTYYYTSLSCDN